MTYAHTFHEVFYISSRYVLGTPITLPNGQRSIQWIALCTLSFLNTCCILIYSCIGTIFFDKASLTYPALHFYTLGMRFQNCRRFQVQVTRNHFQLLFFAPLKCCLNAPLLMGQKRLGILYVNQLSGCQVRRGPLGFSESRQLVW